MKGASGAGRATGGGLPYVYALGDFGHSYIRDQHEESRSSVASSGNPGFTFVAPEVSATTRDTKVDEP